MRYLHSLSKIATMILLSSPLFFTLPVFAAGYQINELSPGLQGDATAGAAAADNDVSALFINPATLSTLTSKQFYLGGSEIFPYVTMRGANATHTVNTPSLLIPSSTTGQVQGASTQNNIAKSVFVPDAYFGWRINDKVAVGLALVAPFGMTTRYNTDSVVRFAAVESSIKTLNISPALSYKINNKWSAGAGLQIQYMQASFSNFNGPYTGVSAYDSYFAANYPTYLGGNGWGFGYTLGALFKPDEYTRLGIGYRSQVAQHLSGNGQQYTSPGGLVPAPSHHFLFNGSTSITAGVKTPPILTFGAARDIRNWTVKATAQVNFWSNYQQLTLNTPEAFGTTGTIQGHWKNSWFTAFGADYHATPAWTVRGGVAYDQTPTKDTYRDPRLPDADRIWLTAGATYALDKHFSFDGAYEHLFSKNQTVNVTQAAGSSATSVAPLEVNQVYARYKASVDIVALALRYSF